MKKINISIILYLYSIVSFALKNTIEYNGCFYEYNTETAEAKCVKSPDDNYTYSSELKIVDSIIVDTRKYSVVSIDPYTFKDSKSIKNVTLGENILKIGISAFEKSSIEKILFNNRLEMIMDQCFFQCNKLKNIDLPQSLQSVGLFAFAYSGIEHLDIKYNINGVAANAFLLPDCKSVTFHNGVTFVQNYAFNMYNIEILNFPSTITLSQDNLNGFANIKKILLQRSDKVEHSTFAFDYTLSKNHEIECFINYNTVPPIIGERMFPDEVFANCTLVVPDESIDAYRNAPGWCKFGSIKGLAGVDDVASDTPEVVAREYFNVNGQKIDAPQKGALSIERAVMTDGSVRVSKIQK